MTIFGIIPARYGSTRFEGKPLALIAGKPLIQRVYERARMVRDLDQVVVATDDTRILDAVFEFGGQAVMTHPDHPSGTDRLAEAAEILGAEPEDIVVNIQGDQPVFDPEVISRVIRPLLEDPNLPMSTPAVPLTDPKQINDPNVVKVVFNNYDLALYFSRAPIPCPREGGRADYFRHVGIYVYRAEFLQQFVTLPLGRLEALEKLEQLRVLEHGYPIKVVVTDLVSLDVDVPEDVARVEAFLKSE